jgi:hypothetical protein
VFGRRNASPPPPVTTEQGKPGGKGRPTPKRSEAERTRKKASVPRDRKEAMREARKKARAEREAMRRALVAGEEKALPARDRGPVRRLVRDIVDSRRNVGELFLPLALSVLILGAFSRTVQVLSYLVWLAMIVLLTLDLLVLRRRIRRLVAQRHPDARIKGLFLYGLLRSTQLRRLRLPPPRVKPGEKI